jgi:hypothetical protein
VKIFTNAVPLTDGANTQTIYSTSVAWGGDDFGVAWVRDRELSFRRVKTSGALVGSLVSVGDPAFSTYGAALSLSRVKGQDFQLFFRCCMSRPPVHARRIAEDGSVLGVTTRISQFPVREHVFSAISGDQVAVAFSEVDQVQTPQPTFYASYSRVNGALEKLDAGNPYVGRSETQPALGFSTVIAGNDTGYALAWYDGTTRFAELDRDGKVTCGPVDLGAKFPADAFPAWVPTDMAWGPEGFVIVGTGKASDISYPVDVVHVRAGCQYVQRLRVVESGGYVSAPAIASAGDYGFGLVWSEYFSQYYHVYARTIGSLFCKN